MAKSVSMSAVKANIESYYVEDLKFTSNKPSSLSIGHGNGNTRLYFDDESKVAVDSFENGSLEIQQKSGHLKLSMEESVPNLNVSMGEGEILVSLPEPKVISSIDIKCTEICLSEDIKKFFHNENIVEMPDGIQFSCVFGQENNLEPVNMWRINVIRGKVKIEIRSGWIENLVKKMQQ